MSMSERLDVHFLNVDHGDCTILVHPEINNNKDGRFTIVDMNDWKDKQSTSYNNAVAGLNPDQELVDGHMSVDEFRANYVSPETYAEEYLDDPLEYYQDLSSGVRSSIWRFILTHPDLDHMSGISRLVDEEGFDYFWDTENTKTLDTDDDFGPRFDTDDWETYQSIRDGETDVNVISPTRGEANQFWDDDNIELIHPTTEYTEYVNKMNEDYSDDNQVFNDISYVLEITHGNQTILLCGDVMKHAWNDIIDEKGTEYFEDINILKASHHGRKSGFHREVVETMDPDYVILSVGAKPDTDAHQQYKNACGDDTEVLSTRQYGTIKAICTTRRSMISKAVPDGIF